eukprot:Phypoly_transcript_03648.p1 GENE.Phypoly_transcript_03648~~Phypoly_transcript_03648.p1  ORF type:complete len:714 (+),score=57.97 Phypoly_transcript_03648:224-2365(+)
MVTWKRGLFSLIFLVSVSLALAAGGDLYRCGPIPDNRTVYTSFFDSSNGHDVLTIELTTNTASGYKWQDIIQDRTKWDEFQPWVYCQVSFGPNPPVNCTVQRKGQWSMNSPLPSLKIKLANDTEYKGMDKIVLNKSPWDITRMRAKLSYELMQRVDNMASLFTQFVNLTVDGKPYGLYTWIEELSKDMLRAHGLGSDSYLYKGTSVFWNLDIDDNVKEVDDPTYDKDFFELNWDIKGAQNHSLLINAYKLISDANLDSRTVMESVFNVDNFASWLAFNYLIANHDLQFNNFGIYAPQEWSNCSYPTPIYMLSWDSDGAWHQYLVKGQIYGVDYSRVSVGLQYFWYMRVVKRFLEVDEYVDLLKAKIAYIATNTLSEVAVANLTNQYKPIIRPILESQPDVSNLAWGSTIEDWSRNVDLLSLIPTGQYSLLDSTARNPMPFNTYISLTDDTSIFFYWDHSYILYNQKLGYEFSLASNRAFGASSIMVTFNTTYTYFAIATEKLKGGATYYWRVICRSAENPDNYMTSYQSLPKGGWGISSFVCPSPKKILPAPPAVRITHSQDVMSSDGKVYTYATIDDVDPTSTGATCANELFVIPDGWMIAENSNRTRGNIAAVGLPWGGGFLVLADGVRINATTGLIIDAFGDVAQHLVAKEVKGDVIAFYANCTTTSNNRILLTRGSAASTYPKSAPTKSGASVRVASCVLVLCALVLIL